MSEFTKGDVVFMKASSGMMGYGNAQCISEVHSEQLGTISLYGHNQHYKTYDIARVVEHNPLIAAAPDLYEACKFVLAFEGQTSTLAPVMVEFMWKEALEKIEAAISKANPTPQPTHPSG